MPIQYNLPTVKIMLIEDTRSILELYHEMLKVHQIPIGEDSSKPKSDVVPENAKRRIGIFVTVLAAVERVAGGAYGANEITLPSIELNFAPPAELLRRCYVSYLNSVLLAEGCSPTETNKKEVNSKYALVHILLNRLVSVALSRQFDTNHDGDNLVKVLECFVSGLNKRQLLDRQNNNVSEFQKELVNTHITWVSRIKHMVGAIDKLEKPRTTVTSILTNLKITEKTIQRQLLAFFQPKQNEIAVFSDDWIETSLTQFEQQLLLKHGPENKMVIIKQGDHQTQREIVIGLVNSDLYRDTIQRDKIQRLYNALEQTQRVQEVFSQLDLLLTFANWIAILSGVLNIQGFSDLLRNHSEICRTALTLNKQEQKILNANAGRALLAHEAAAGESLQQLMLENSLELENLQDPSLKEQIFRLMGASVSSLVHLQNNFEGKYQLINRDKIFALGLGRDVGAIAQITSEKIITQERLMYEKLLLEHTTQSNQSEQIRFATKTLLDGLAEGCKDIVFLKLMKVQGANLLSLQIDSENFKGDSALHIAVSTQNEIAFNWLLNEAVDVNIHDVHGNTPMDRASELGLRYFANELRKRGGHSNQTELATQKMHELIDDEELTEDSNSATQEFMEQLNNYIRRGADVNGINRWQNAWHGDRPLHTLIIKGNQKLITWFLNMGADLSLKDQGSEQRAAETPIEKMHRTRARFEKETMAYLHQYHPNQLPNDLREVATQPSVAAMLNANGILPVPKQAPEPATPEKKEKSLFASFRK